MPEYGFASNKGYGASVHIEALKKYGPARFTAEPLSHILSPDVGRRPGLLMEDCGQRGGITGALCTQVQGDIEGLPTKKN